VDTPDFVYDEKAVAIVGTMEQTISRQRLPSQGEVVALLNAIEVHVEEGRSDPTVLRHLCDALLALADARGVDRKKTKLDQRVDSLLRRAAARHHTTATR
jgi:hypothetical protein